MMSFLLHHELKMGWLLVTQTNLRTNSFHLTEFYLWDELLFILEEQGHVNLSTFAKMSLGFFLAYITLPSNQQL